MINIRAVRNEADYDWALSEVEAYFLNVPALGTEEADRFDILSALIEAYEAKHWQIEAADPIDTIKYVMAEKGHSQRALADVLGSRSRASEVLSRKRPLTLPMVYRLNSIWKIPAEPLIRPYHTHSESGDSVKVKKERKTKTEPRKGVLKNTKENKTAGMRAGPVKSKAAAPEKT